MSDDKPRNRYLQRRARELQNQYAIKYTAALRIAKEEHRQAEPYKSITSIS